MVQLSEVDSRDIVSLYAEAKRTIAASTPLESKLRCAIIGLLQRATSSPEDWLHYRNQIRQCAELPRVTDGHDITVFANKVMSAGIYALDDVELVELFGNARLVLSIFTARCSLPRN